MKLKKTLRKQIIDNPMRIPPPFKSVDTRCRISYGYVSENSESYTVIVDAEKEVEKFWKEVDKIPYPEKYDDLILEVWFFTEKWLPKLKKWAVKYFDTVIFEDYTSGTKEKLK